MPNDDSVKAKAERLRRHVRDLGPSPSRFVQDADACAVAVLAHEQEREALAKVEAIARNARWSIAGLDAALAKLDEVRRI